MASRFKKCVKSVKARGGAADPRAVCAAIGRKKYGKKKFQEMAAAGKRKAKRKRNPGAEAAEAYEITHGKAPTVDTTVDAKVKYHATLAGMGKLEFLEVRAAERDGNVTLSGFGKGCMLAMNEKRTQLFVVGGDQTVDLKAFGIRDPHETEVLGDVVKVGYFTTKTHLVEKDGGTAVYVHKFEPPRPKLIYDVRNKRLMFAGGGYSIPAEGIDG